MLVKILPFIAKETCFAIKGGTAINLFYRDLPRLSVDIDLTYINFDPRQYAYNNINSAMESINNNLIKLGYKSLLTGNEEKKIICTDNYNYVSVKIEPNYTLRGCIQEPRVIPVCGNVEEKFGYTENLILSKPETYGGKICAALDRQHPRDLFDIYQMINNNELSNDVVTGFIVMLLSAPRPLYEIINPNILDRVNIYNSEFQGMTDVDFTYEQHVETLKYLIDFLQKRLKDDYKEVLLDFVSLSLELKNLCIPNVENLPAIQWKIKNLQRLKDINSEKFNKEYIELKNILS